MFNKTLIALAISAFAATAIAQINIPVAKPAEQAKPMTPAVLTAPKAINPVPMAASVAAPVAAPVAAARVAAPVAAPAVSSSVASSMPAAPVASVSVSDESKPMNPFRGRTLGFESSQRELETAKLETQLLEERIKQAGLAEDLKTLPLKKQVEAAQATTARLKEEAVQKDTTKASVAAAVAAAPAPVVKVVKARPVKKAAPVIAATPPGQAPRARMQAVELTSVMSLGESRSAVLDFDGNVLTVKQGDMTPLGAVDIVSDQAVRINGQTYKVHGATLSRVVVSDPKPVDPKAAGGMPGVNPFALGAPGVAPASSINAASFPGAQNGNKSGMSPSLPPLQLPSGVTLLPPAK